MTLVLICFYIFVFTSLVLTSFLIGKTRIRLHKSMEYANQLEDLLDLAPDGYFYETTLEKKLLLLLFNKALFNA